MRHESEYLNTSQTAKYLGVSNSWLEGSRIKECGPPYVKVGRIVRYNRASIDRWMLDNQVLASGMEGQS